MSRPSHITAESESKPSVDVLIIPTEFFFVERIEVPPAVAPSERADYAELSMEGLAPFPLEQLRWGFLVSPDGQEMLIYAALYQRLKKAGYTDLESPTWVLPDFATLHGARFAGALELILQSETAETHLRYPSGESLPSSIRSLRGETSPKTASVLRFQLLPIELTEKGLPIFQFETQDSSLVEGHWSPLSLDGASLWQADIRPVSYKTIERNTRRTTALITRIMGYAAIVALGLVVLEGLLYAGQFWLGTQEAKIEAQTTAVRRIEDKESLMNKLEQVAQNQLRPIAILEAANAIRIGLGTTGIEYDEVVIEGSNRLTIEGKANTINELNAYTNALGKSGSFQLVEDPKSITRSGKTTFTATLDYQHSERIEESSVREEQAVPEPLETTG